tara:strand:+ start:458 stop:868 length:411 start_codon:yes stop_codon:yes gene_type:complete
MSVDNSSVKIRISKDDKSDLHHINLMDLWIIKLHSSSRKPRKIQNNNLNKRNGAQAIIPHFNTSKASSIYPSKKFITAVNMKNMVNVATIYPHTFNTFLIRPNPRLIFMEKSLRVGKNHLRFENWVVGILIINISL